MFFIFRTVKLLSLFKLGWMRDNRYLSQQIRKSMGVRSSPQKNITTLNKITNLEKINLAKKIEQNKNKPVLHTFLPFFFFGCTQVQLTPEL